MIFFAWQGCRDHRAKRKVRPNAPTGFLAIKLRGQTNFKTTLFYLGPLPSYSHFYQKENDKFIAAIYPAGKMNCFPERGPLKYGFNGPALFANFIAWETQARKHKFVFKANI